jgi:hypothetical protein
LKKEMEELKQGRSGGALAPPSNKDITDMSKDEMAQKLLSYQEFMAKYIVEAQQQKAKAVQAAELALKERYDEKIILLQGSTSAPAPPASVSAIQIETVSKESQLYKDRSEKVSAAAKAGKSRWGDLENERSAQAAVAVTPATLKTTTNGVQVARFAVPTVSDRSLYDKRNAMISAAGKAGKSRWGSMEVAKATKEAVALPAASNDAPKPAAPNAPKVEVQAEVPPEVVAADHGLRNDGGVGGPSLADRINLGSQLLADAGVPVANNPTVPAVATLSVFNKRNLMVAAAGKAGKSRWGEMEVQRAQTLVAALPSAAERATPVVSAAASTVSPEVEAADHGLRNDGGVGGPSLAQRINLGASILGLEP